MKMGLNATKKLKMNALEEALGTTLTEIDAEIASVQAAIDVQ